MPEFKFLNEAEEVEFVEVESNLNENNIKLTAKGRKAEGLTAAPQECLRGQ